MKWILTLRISLNEVDSHIKVAGVNYSITDAITSICVFPVTQKLRYSNFFSRLAAET